MSLSAKLGSALYVPKTKAHFGSEHMWPWLSLLSNSTQVDSFAQYTPAGSRLVFLLHFGQGILWFSTVSPSLEQNKKDRSAPAIWPLRHFRSRRPNLYFRHHPRISLNANLLVSSLLKRLCAELGIGQPEEIRRPAGKGTPKGALFGSLLHARFGGAGHARQEWIELTNDLCNRWQGKSTW
jgi:hypothetical protein